MSYCQTTATNPTPGPPPYPRGLLAAMTLAFLKSCFTPVGQSRMAGGDLDGLTG